MNYCMQCMKPLSGPLPCPHCGFDGSLPENGPALRAGTLLHGRYLLGLPLGRGGFGLTYIARDTTLDLRVAVKEFFPFGYAARGADGGITVADPQHIGPVQSGMQRFLKEARILARFGSESGVVSVRDFFEENSTAYIVMEYLEGSDLRSVLLQRLFTPDEIFSKMRPLMDSLEKIHAQGVVHRDISPDNIMLLPDGSLKLMDFGAALLESDGAPLSQSLTLKRGYAPPEQYILSGECGPWTDIYSLCATIYHCITGAVPPESPQREACDEIVWPSQSGHPISRAQENVLKKGLEPDPADRFRSISLLRRWLNAPDDGTLTSYIPKTAARPEGPAFPPSDPPAPPPQKKAHSPEGEKPPTEEEKRISGGRSEPPSPLRREKKPAFGPRSLRIGAAALIFALVLALAFAAPRLLPRSGQNPPSQNIEFTLTPNEMSLAEYASASETAQARLDILAGEGNYIWTEQDNSVRLSVPRSVFGEYDPENVLRAYVTRPIDIFLFDSSEGAVWDPPRANLSRADLESVVLFPGTPPGAEEDACEQYIALTLTPKAAERLSPLLSTWKSVGYGQDVALNSYFYLPAISAGDGRTFYLVNSDRGDRFHQTLLYNLTHAPSPQAFGVMADPTALWEDPASAQIRGRNQVRIEELSGDTVTLFYETYASAVSAGEQLDTAIAFRSRLDSFSVPYALGIPEESENGIAVCIDAERMNWALMEALGRNDPFSMSSGLYRCSAYSSAFAVQQEGLSITPAPYHAEDTAAFLSYVVSEGAPLLLGVDSFPLLGADLSSVPEDGCVLFDTVPALGDAPVREAAWLPSVIASIAGNRLPNTYYLSAHRLSEGASLGLDLHIAKESFSQAVHSVREGLSVHFSEDSSTAYVHLALNVDESMPAEAAALAKEIYLAADFASSGFEQLTVYMTDDEDDAAKERARIFFYRLSDLYGQENSYARVCVDIIFVNGRMERYADSFRALVESDPFYTSLADPLGAFTWCFEN